MSNDASRKQERLGVSKDAHLHPRATFERRPGVTHSTHLGGSVTAERSVQ
jgi:hypothetical protein